MSVKKRSAQRRKSGRKSAAAVALRELQKKAASEKIGNPRVEAQNRWQRAVRYTWDKNRGRG